MCNLCSDINVQSGIYRTHKNTEMSQGTDSRAVQGWPQGRVGILVSYPPMEKQKVGAPRLSEASTDTDKLCGLW